jgi:hypothetical protein
MTTCPQPGDRTVAMSCIHSNPQAYKYLEQDEILKDHHKRWTASVVYWSEFLPTDPEILGLIPGATKFPET